MLKFKKFYLILQLITIGVLGSATSTPGIFDWMSGYPDHYNDCNACKYDKNKQLNSLPFDVQVTDSIWFKSNSSLFLDGFTAYLYSDCDVNFDIYQSCTASKSLYSVVIPKNQARDVTAEKISQKLEEAGFESLNITLYICIYPVGGTGGRLMCFPYNTGYNSTCDDILTLLPGMTFVSSHADDVYEILPENISDSHQMYLQWSGEATEICHLSIARGSCNGSAIAQYDFNAENNIYLFDTELLKDVKTKGESLFAHFSHSESDVCRLSLQNIAFFESITDTTICQGRVFKYQNIATSEPGVYFYDTLQLSEIEWEISGYNVIFTEPEPQADSIALMMSQLPYNYRGQQITDFGNYDLTIHNSGDCDERILLNVSRKYTTVVNTTDTTLCEGKAFVHDGVHYFDDVTFTDSLWSDNGDVMNVNMLNVKFITSVVYDTLALTTKDVVNYNYQGIHITAYGDYSTEVYHPECPYTLYLHVCRKVITVAEPTKYVKLCNGDVYTHNDVSYTTDVLLRDTTWRDADTQVVKSTNVHFVINPLTYDTLHLGYADLPYLYKDYAKITQMGDTTVTILVDDCDADVKLHVVHKFVTDTLERDTVVCQGKTYMHNGVAYNAPTSITDSEWADEDLLVITTTRLYFAEPEPQYDTLQLKAADLPYAYRGQQITNFGNHELLIQTDGECDERISLTVEHLTVTVETKQDTVLCQGKVYLHNEVEYSEPIELIDSLWINADTLMVTTTRLSFAEPELQHDTLVLKTTELPYIYKQQYTVPAGGFGNHDVTIRHDGECDELYRLHVDHRIDTIKTVRDTMICFGGVYKYEKGGKTYIAKTDISFGSSQTLNADTFLIDSLYVRFALQPDVIYDTLLLREKDLPYTYSGQKITEFKDYYWQGLMNMTTKCKENVYLHVAHLTEQTNDVELCEGKYYIYNNVEYTEPATFIDSAWVDEFQFEITTTNLSFIAPDVEYDTLYLSADELAAGYYYELADDYIYAPGVYDYRITADNECTRVVSLTVEKAITVSADNATSETVDPKLIMIDGVIYIHYNNEYYTLMGEKVNLTIFE